VVGGDHVSANVTSDLHAATTSKRGALKAIKFSSDMTNISIKPLYTTMRVPSNVNSSNG